MASPPHDSPTLFSYLDIEEEVDSGSDISIHCEEEALFNPYAIELNNHTAPNPFAERGQANELSAQHQTTDFSDAFTTNSLDEQQRLSTHQEE